ncbi:unnamed protein product [Rotaria sp. Silwood2]|nr:unnamed protein product [Rotaria sp. Silwood2]
MESTIKPFDIRSIPIQAVSEPVKSLADIKKVSTIYEFGHSGPIFESSSPVDLIRSAVEYVFHINNTLNDQLLEKVTVQMDGSTEGVEVVHYTPYSLKKCNDMDTTYTLVKLPDDSSAVTGTLSCAMKYTVKDCDPATGEPDNEEG